MLGKPKRKRSKSERKILEKKLWDTASLYIRKRDGCCVTCGATEGLTMSHWIKCGKQRVRNRYCRYSGVSAPARMSAACASA